MSPRPSRPPTPGDLLAQLLLAREMSQSECARRLGVSRRRVIALIKGRRISGAMARRLGEVFGVDAEVWLAMQAQAEAWDALHGAIPAAQDEEHDEIREDVDGFITNTSTNTRKGLEEDGFETAST